MVQRLNPVDPKQDGIIAQYVCPDALKYGDGRIHRVAMTATRCGFRARRAGQAGADRVRGGEAYAG